VDRDSILEAMRHRPSWRRQEVQEAEVLKWPQLVPLVQVCQRFHKQPRMLTAVATLVHPAVVVAVTRAKDIQPGDMIKFTSKDWGRPYRRSCGTGKRRAGYCRVRRARK